MSKEDNSACELSFRKDTSAPISIIASFRSGVPDFLADLEKDDMGVANRVVEVPGLEIGLYEKTKKKTKRHIVALQTKRMLYTAQDFGDSSSSLNYNKYVPSFKKV